MLANDTELHVVSRRSLLLLLLPGVALMACGSSTGPSPDGEVASVTVTPASLSVHALNVTRRFSARARDASGSPIPNVSFVWSSSNENVATVDGAGLVTTIGDGEATITATADTVSGSATLEVAIVVLEHIDPFLATPAAGHLWEVPVVILRYLPTADGINLDVTKAPDYYELGEISLADLKARIDEFDLRVKFALEEGSRFRGYKNPAAAPSLGYRVVAYITVYEHMPAGAVLKRMNGYDVYLPDYHQMFDRLDMDDYVNTQGVKEIWFWHTGLDPSFPSFDPDIHDPADFRGGWESNMSSPTTGDISNSDRSNTDLPVYNSTFVLYGQNYRRTQAEALHNHGHQLEAILSHANARQDGNSDLFWKQFVGQDAGGAFITGRAGWTHMPPNTTVHYDYENPTLVWSDIEDWIPDNSGTKTQVNVNTWGDIDYAWPGPADFDQRVESQWYTYWWQNMPGRDNAIVWAAYQATNWWAFTGDWDGSMAAGLGLYEANTAHISVPNNAGTR
jgi:hypothetical protein